MEGFSELYKTFTTAQLLDILDHEQEFQPDAVEAARRELNSRALTTEQLASERVVAAAPTPIQAVASRAESAFSALIGMVHPIQNTGVTATKYLRLIAIFLGIMAVSYWYTSIQILLLIFEYDRSFDASTAGTLVKALLATGAAVLLWRHHKNGWQFGVIFLSQALMTTLLIFFNLIKTMIEVPLEYTTAENFTFVAGYILSELAMISLYGLPLIVLCRKTVTYAFDSSRQDIISCIATGAGLTLLVYFLR